jgi:hypothetical protein
MSLLERQLQAELQTLKTEAGRKYTKVRESAERADRCLREIIDAGAASDSDVAAAVRRVGEMEEMLNPAILALETKTSKFMCLGWGYLTRLASYDALAGQAFGSVTQALRAAVESSGDENVQLRVLQCIGACLQARNLLSSRPTVCILVEAALSLYANKSPIISNTAGATLRQGISTLFEFAATSSAADDEAADAIKADDAAETDQAQGEDVSGAQGSAASGGGGGGGGSSSRQRGSSESVAVAAMIASDLCLLAVGSSAQVLQLKTPAHPGTDMLCLDVVDSLLRAHGTLCMRNRALRNVIHSVMAPFVLRQLERNLSPKTRETKFGYACRMARLTDTILMLDSETPDKMDADKAALVMVVLNLVSADGLPLWQQQLYLETISGFSRLPNKAHRFRLLFLVALGAGGAGAVGGSGGVERGGDMPPPTHNLLVLWVATFEKVIRRILGPLFEGSHGGGGGAATGSAAAATAAAAARAAVEALEYAGVGGRGVGGGGAGARGPGLQQSVTQLGQNTGGGGGSGEAPAGAGSESVCLELAIRALCDVVEAVGELTGIPQHCDVASLTLAGRPRCDAQVMMRNVTIVRHMLEATWQHMLAALQLTILTVRASSLLEGVMLAYASFTRACAILQLVGPRDKALAPLCRACLPAAGPGGGEGAASYAVPLLAHNVIMSKTLLMLAFEMGGALGEGWMMVLEVLQRLDSALINRGMMPAGEELSKISMWLSEELSNFSMGNVRVCLR